MSETMKSNKKPNKTTTYMVCGVDEKGLVVEEAKKQLAVDNIPGLPMEISTGNFQATKTLDGKTEVRDDKGNLIGYLEGDGTISRRLETMDRNAKRKDDTVMEHE